jgi:arylsulfatase A-like enzyme
MASMVTGLYPHHHGYLDWERLLDASIRTVFDAFADGGLEVGTFVFDTGYLFRDLPNANVLGTTDTLDGVVEWLRASRQSPFLLFVHSWATHMPTSIEHARRESWREAKQRYLDGLRADTAGGLEACREEYRVGVEYVSEVLVAELLAELETQGLSEQTAFVFLSDHGESWGERFEDKSEIKGIYHLHGSTLYDEIVQVPLIVVAPGATEPAVVGTQVSTVDVVPTLLSLAGLPALDTDGVSLLESARAPDHDRAVFTFTTDRGVLSQAGVRRWPWKVIRHLSDDRREAYRVDLDPRERVDRAAEAPEELAYLLDQELANVERRELSDEEEAAVVSRLSDLGYL